MCRTLKFDAKESKLFADFTFCPNKISPESIEPITFVKRTIILFFWVSLLWAEAIFSIAICV